MATPLGMTYEGSLEEVRGADVIEIRDCTCCRNYASGRVSAAIRYGTKIFHLDHARPESFRTADGLPYDPAPRVG
jgi:hypothetical protein